MRSLSSIRSFQSLSLDPNSFQFSVDEKFLNDPNKVADLARHIFEYCGVKEKSLILPQGWFTNINIS